MKEFDIDAFSKMLVKLIGCCLCIYFVISNLDSIGNAISVIIGKLSPFILGGIVAVMLNIPVTLIENYLAKKGINHTRNLSIFLALLSTFGFLIIIVLIILPELYHATIAIVDLVSNTLNELAFFQNSNSNIVFLDNLRIDWLSIKHNLEAWFQTYSGELVNNVLYVFKDTASVVVTFCMGLVFSIYLLGNKDILSKQVIRLMNVWLPQKFVDIISYVSNVSLKVFNQFMIGQVTEAIILGLLCGIGMAILRIPYAMMIGVLIGVTALVPYFGALVGECVGFILIFAVNPFKAIVFLIYILILQQIEGNIIYPKVVGSKINLPAIWVFSSIILGGNIAGPLGMFFAVPIASIIYEMVKDSTLAKEKVKMMEEIS